MVFTSPSSSTNVPAGSSGGGSLRRWTTDLALDALGHALFTRRPEGTTDLAAWCRTAMPDRNTVAIAVTQRLIGKGIDPSVGSVGDAYDSALAQPTVGSFKNELIRRQGPWRDADHLEVQTLQWIRWVQHRSGPRVPRRPHAGPGRAAPDHRLALATAG